MSLKPEQFISNRYGLIRILVAAHSVLILGLVLWMLSPNFRSIIKLDFSKNIPLSEKVIDSQRSIAKNANGSSTNWQISLVSHGPVPLDQLLDSPSNIFQSYRYQYKVTSGSPTPSSASRSHLVTVELYYGPNNGDLRNRLGTAFKDFTFKNFSAAFAFLTQIALAAEKLDHHPEIKNVYNKVSLKLNTHDVGGLTELDFKLAKQIDKLLAYGF